MITELTREPAQKRRNRGGWTKIALNYIARVKTVLRELHKYWPVTLRQVYYQLVAAREIGNTRNEYQKLSRLLTKARMDGLIPWEAIEDRARSKLSSLGWGNADVFIRSEFEGFLQGFRRDLLQSQDVALEVWVEKDALSRVCHRAAFPYCVNVIVARGFSSISYVHECRQRIEANTRLGKLTKILYFGDLDPSGWEMLPAMMETLKVEMNLGDWVEGRRHALNPDHVLELGLPRSVDAMKDTDSRTPKYKAMLREAGYPDDLAVELDALPPATLEGLVRAAIEENLDLSIFRAEEKEQQTDLRQIAGIREDICRFVNQGGDN